MTAAQLAHLHTDAPDGELSELELYNAAETAERNGYALQYVLDFELFVKIATQLNIEWSK